MRILLTNDDGINAKGINVLYQHIKELGETYIVAPERERSASGHGITVHKPLRADEREKRQYAVSGTPADCVKLALEALMPAPPDLIISGINLGPNLGTDVLYSGTVSAAVEGIMAGIPSFAVSLVSHDGDSDFNSAAEVTAKLCRRVHLNEVPPETLLNINVPAVQYQQLKGIKITTLGLRRYVDAVQERKDPRGKSYYWLAGRVEDISAGDDTDIAAVNEQFVSLTPVHFDLTNYRILEQIRSWQLEI
ncbi:5'/3'-nucleotidase SurE [Metallumcola ferriviriculae]|uniref:5'-nucleotidase SurE n=1 Tax=Metallumcola ferriviriculae TaxID=3039180 RepID=A0AAU0UQH5_9FIRM|nr:5'/3'-nucleotidase SurE [Desulfitibacteraceae bacterium MK1]